MWNQGHLPFNNAMAMYLHLMLREFLKRLFMRFIRRPKFEFSVFSFGIFDPRESLNVETLSILFLKEIVGRMKNPHFNKTKSASMVYLCLHRSRN